MSRTKHPSDALYLAAAAVALATSASYAVAAVAPYRNAGWGLTVLVFAIAGVVDWLGRQPAPTADVSIEVRPVPKVVMPMPAAAPRPEVRSAPSDTTSDTAVSGRRVRRAPQTPDGALWPHIEERPMSEVLTGERVTITPADFARASSLLEDHFFTGIFAEPRPRGQTAGERAGAVRLVTDGPRYDYRLLVQGQRNR